MQAPLGSVFVDEPGKWNGVVPDFNWRLYEMIGTQEEAALEAELKWAIHDEKRAAYRRRRRQEQIQELLRRRAAR